MKRTIWALIIFCSIISSSCDDDESITEKGDQPTDTIISDKVTLQNQWVKEIMQEVYLWETYIPVDLNPSSDTSTFDFFKKTIYEDEDKWSWISDDYYATSDMLNGVSTTAGHHFALYLKSDKSSIFGLIEYTMKGSPADLAGIKRGDIFTSINNTSLDINNYVNLLTLGGSYSIGLDTLKHKGTSPYDNPTTPYKTVEIIEVEGFQENPIYIDTIYEVEGHKIAYFMYNSFLSAYNSAKDDVFLRFQEQNVTDLIIDLRYNSGGYVIAEEHLANLICPYDKVGDIFKIEVWNDRLTEYLTSTYGEEYLTTRIVKNNNGIDLHGKLVGITTSGTASASEALLNGLSPLVDFTQIGDITHGKYTSIIPLPNEDSSWVVVPVIAKHTNKEGISVKGGLIPDIEIIDYPLDGYELGDIRETMLAEAIHAITGSTDTRSAKTLHSLNKIASFKDGKETTPLPSIIDRKFEFRKQ